MRNQNWKDLIADNPFAANPTSQDQHAQEPVPLFKQDDELTRSDRFSQRVVSLGPHQYIQRAEGLESSASKESIVRNSAFESSMVENSSEVGGCVFRSSDQQHEVHRKESMRMSGDSGSS